MAESPERVEHFLKELEKRSTVKAEEEFKEFTKQLPAGVSLTTEGKLKPWDTRYVMYQYKKNHASIDERAIAEYFPLEKTIDILLELYEEFLGLQFEQINIAQLPHAANVWHPDVKLIKATLDGQLLGYLFLDLHPRDNKYTHACHGSCIHGLRNEQGIQTVPAVSLVIANFPKSVGEKPALLLRNDVNTFFHEFGHAVHALCGATQLNAFSGTKTKRDFVELPSQMLEEWLWQPEVLKRISGHYQSGIKLHDELIAAIIAIKNIDTGFFIRRQLSLAYLSLACFNERIDDNMKREYELLVNRLMPQQEYCPEENFIASFGHLMGYGAQYYGYLWSKVFALDLFDFIKAQGMSGEIGARYRDLVIGKGGSKPPMHLLRDFLGRDPNSEAFFKDMGI
jgi:thimet oligopeptidase